MSSTASRNRRGPLHALAILGISSLLNSSAALAMTPLSAAAAAEARVAKTPSLLLAEIRNSSLDSDHPVRVANLRLQTGLGSLILENGSLYPATPVGDRPVEMVFLGKGRLLVDPPDDVEAAQLELFTGNSPLDAPFTEAVLVVARDQASDALLNRPLLDSPDPARGEHAAVLYKHWKDRAGRRTLGVTAALFQDAVGDTDYDEYFAAWFRSAEFGEFYYVVDPGAEEQVTLGRFVPLDLTQREKYELNLEASWQRGQGRLVGVDIKDLGQFDTWLSASLRDTYGRLSPGSPGFEPDLYTLDVTISKSDQWLSGVARIELLARSHNRRVVRLELSTDLTVEKVTDQEDRELATMRNQSELVVLLPQPALLGDHVVLTVHYKGNPLEKTSRGAWALRDTTGWYPSLGVIKRARFDVTLHWPRSLKLVASGRRVDGGEEDDGLVWERRLQDTPMSGFSFEIGDFAIKKVQVGDIAVTLAFHRILDKFDGPDIKDSIETAVVRALEFFLETYGPLPLQELTVATVDRPFSQGLFGFLTLSRSHVDWTSDLFANFGYEDRRTIIAHEISHQWWGDLVGWKSYRDQWISEAMADYSALLYSKKKLPQGHHVRRGPTSRWRQVLETTTEDGRTLESLGPVVLGQRLSSSISRQAYTAIVYTKGAMVLDMLSRYYTNTDTFPQMLREIIRAAANRQLSTEDLLAAFEKLTQVDLDWFRRQYIYGTGRPVVYYSYAFHQAPDGKWKISGEARQEASFRYVYSVVEQPGGRLGVKRQRVPTLATENSVLVAPMDVRVKQEEAEEASGKKQKKKKGQRKPTKDLVGRILLKGEVTPFEFTLDEEPEVFWIDRHSEVLARFYDESYFPKGTLIDRGANLLADGKLEEAEAAFLQALEAPYTSNTDEVSTARRKNREDKASALDARIHLRLARLYLERQDPDRCEKMVRKAQKLMNKFEESDYESWITVLESHVAIQRGDYDTAFRRLNKMLLRRERSDSTEGYLLLAIAAKMKNEKEVFAEAMATAEAQGARIDLLRQ